MRHNLSPLDAEIEQAFLAKARNTAERSGSLRQTRTRDELFAYYFGKSHHNGQRPLPRNRDDMRACIDDIRVRTLNGTDPLYRLLGLSVATFRHYFMQVGGADYDTADLYAHAAAELLAKP